MRYRSFGRTGLTVSELGVGCSRIGGVRSSSSRRDELAMLNGAVDAGITFFDTADLYSQGQSEVLLGHALRARRSEVIIATKGGYAVDGQRRSLARLKPLLRPIVQHLPVRRAPTGGAGGAPIPQDFSPGYLTTAVEASLRRLGTDYIDLYQLHSPSRSVVELGDYIATLTDLQAQGKIRHFGIAADAPADVMGVDRHPAIASVQTPYSLLHQEAATGLFRKAEAEHLGVIARSCYAAGLFKDDLSEERLRELTPDWEQILMLRELAAELGRPLLEAALQFSLAPTPISVTIVGMRTPDHLRENLRYYGTPRLEPSELAMATSQGRAS